MLENFMFSLNMSLPMFLVMLIGWFLRKKEVIDDGFLTKANTIVFQTALPAMLFLQIAQSDLRESMNLRFVLCAVGGTFAAFGLAWILFNRLIPGQAQSGAAIHAAYRGNYVYVGLALIQNVAGKDLIPSAPLVVAFVLPLYNIFAVILLTVKNPEAGRLKLSSLLLDIVKNPMVVSILIGLPFSICSIPLPFAVTKTLDYLGAIATPLALLLIGANLRMGKVRSNGRAIMISCLYKLVIQPLLLVPVALWMQLSSEEILTIYILFAVPSAVNVFIMTQKMGGDGDLASAIVVMSTIGSVFTLTIGIFLLRTMGIL